MNVQPAALFEAVIEVGDTGLTGTIGVEANDNTGATTVAFTTDGITEIAAGVYAAASLEAPGAEGQYTLIWRDGAAGDVLGVEALTVTSSAPGDPVPPADMYGSVAELARILKKNRNPTEAELAAMERVLVAATGEVNAEIDRVDDLAPWMVMLATEVTLERAVEHWQQAEVPYGIWENALGPIVVGRDTWSRHALKLAPLKQQWGMA
jgi:hypothetical protein